MYQPKAVSSWKRHKNSAWYHKQNLNIIKTTKNWKKEQKPLELKSMKVIEIRTKQNTNETEGSLKSIFSLHENTGLSGKTMKNRPALLQMNLKKVTYSSIFQNRWKKPYIFISDHVRRMAISYKYTASTLKQAQPLNLEHIS